MDFEKADVFHSQLNNWIVCPIIKVLAFILLVFRHFAAYKNLIPKHDVIHLISSNTPRITVQHKFRIFKSY